MFRCISKGQLLFAVLFFVLTVAVCVPAEHGTTISVAQPVAALTSPASNSTTVTNNVTVSSASISLGSVLEANGQVTAAGKPLANASIALHVGDLIVAYAQTDQLGRYAFSIPIGVYYFPAAFSNGAKVYTVVEPNNSSLTNTTSAVASVSVDLVPLYAIVTVITVALVVGVYLYVRRLRKKSSPAAASTPSGQSQTPLVASETTTEEPLQERGSAPSMGC